MKSSTKGALDSQVTASLGIILLFGFFTCILGVAGSYGIYKGKLSIAKEDFQNRLENKRVLFSLNQSEPIFSEEPRVRILPVGTVSGTDGSVLPVYDINLFTPDELYELDGGQKIVTHTKFSFRIAVMENVSEKELFHWDDSAPTRTAPGAQTMLYAMQMASSQ